MWYPLLPEGYETNKTEAAKGDIANKIESVEGDETKKIESGEEVIESDLEVAVCDSSDTDNVEDKEPASEWFTCSFYFNFWGKIYNCLILRQLKCPSIVMHGGVYSLMNTSHHLLLVFLM